MSTNPPSEPRHEPAARGWARGWMGDSSQLLLSQVLTVLATSIAAIMIARTLSPDDWGVFSAFLGLSMALALVADFGLGTWLLREFSRAFADGQSEATGRSGGLLSAALAVNLVAALPLVAAALVWSALARPGADVAVALICLLCYGAFTAGANALETHFRARRRVRLVLAASLLEKGILIVLVVSAAVLDAGLAAIGLAYVVAGVTRIVFDGAILVVRHAVPVPRPRTGGIVEVARSSFPFALNTASLNLVPRLDTLVILVMSATSAGWFAIGDRVLGPALLLPATFGATLYPFMASSAARRVPPWKLAASLGALGLVLAVVGIVLAPVLIPLLFGASYEDAVPVAQVMLLVVPLVYATSPLLVVAYSLGQERPLLLPILALSLAGTVAIVIGQALGGATYAAAGYVTRSASFLLVVGAVALVAWRRQEAASSAHDDLGHTRMSAQSS